MQQCVLDELNTLKHCLLAYGLNHQNCVKVLWPQPTTVFITFLEVCYEIPDTPVCIVHSFVVRLVERLHSALRCTLYAAGALDVLYPVRHAFWLV